MTLVVSARIRPEQYQLFETLCYDAIGDGFSINYGIDIDLVTVTLHDYNLALKLEDYLSQLGSSLFCSPIDDEARRSVIIPFTNMYTEGNISERFSIFGDIESIEDLGNTLRIQYYDSHSVDKLRTWLRVIPPPSASQDEDRRISGILNEIY
jgi:hypothetical protein